MEVRMTNIKNLGYAKILRHYLNDEGYIDILQTLSRDNTYFAKVTPFGLMGNIDMFDDIDRSTCTSLYMLDMVKGIRDSEEDFKKAKKNFRYSWSSMWEKDIQQALIEIGEEKSYDILYSLALYLPYIKLMIDSMAKGTETATQRELFDKGIIKQGRTLADIQNYYIISNLINLLFAWYLITQQGQELDIEDFLMVMIVEDMDTFIKKVEEQAIQLGIVL